MAITTKNSLFPLIHHSWRSAFMWWLWRCLSRVPLACTLCIPATSSVVIIKRLHGPQKIMLLHAGRPKENTCCHLLSDQGNIWVLHFDIALFNTAFIHGLNSSQVFVYIWDFEIKSIKRSATLRMHLCTSAPLPSSRILRAWSYVFQTKDSILLCM